MGPAPSWKCHVLTCDWYDKIRSFPSFLAPRHKPVQTCTTPQTVQCVVCMRMESHAGRKVTILRRFQCGCRWVALVGAPHLCTPILSHEWGPSGSKQTSKVVGMRCACGARTHLPHTHSTSLHLPVIVPMREAPSQIARARLSLRLNLCKNTSETGLRTPRLEQFVTEPKLEQFVDQI